MRLQRYLSEVFLDGLKSGYEIYKNPTSQELRNIVKNGSRGFRFVIDAKGKNFYVTDAELTHSEMFDKSKELQSEIKGFKYNSSYFRKGEGLDYVLTGSTERNNFDEIFSDTLTGDIQDLYNEDNWPHCYAQLNKLILKDFTFMSRWIKPKQIEELIQEAIDKLGKIMAGEEEPD